MEELDDRLAFAAEHARHLRYDEGRVLLVPLSQRLQELHEALAKAEETGRRTVERLAVEGGIRQFEELVEEQAGKPLVARVLEAGELGEKVEKLHELVDDALRSFDTRPSSWRARFGQAREEHDEVLRASIKDAVGELQRNKSLAREIIEELTQARALGRWGPLADEMWQVVEPLVPEIDDARAWYIPRSDITIRRKSSDKGSFCEAEWVGSRVAVKEMHDTDRLRPEEWKQFDEDLETMHRLVHPHVITFYGASHMQAPSLIVYELAPLGNLSEHLSASNERKGKWELLYQAARGLEYLHRKKIVHGNLKASNILISADYNAKLSDFGLMRSKDKTHGTRWRAPECFRGELTYASDVYSLGLCIYEAVTGRIPYDVVRSPSAIEQKICEGKVPGRPKGVDDEVWRLIEQMTRLNPRDRLSLPDVLHSLKELANRGDSYSPIPDTKPATETPMSVPTGEVESLRLRHILSTELDRGSVLPFGRSIQTIAKQGTPDSFFASRLPRNWAVTVERESNKLRLEIFSSAPPHKCYHAPIHIDCAISAEVDSNITGAPRDNARRSERVSQLIAELGLTDGDTFNSVDLGDRVLSPSEMHETFLLILNLADDDFVTEQNIEELSGLQLAIDTTTAEMRWVSPDEAGPMLVLVNSLGRVHLDLEISKVRGFNVDGMDDHVAWEILDSSGQRLPEGGGLYPSQITVDSVAALRKLRLHIAIKRGDSRLPPSQSMTLLSDKIPDATKPSHEASGGAAPRCLGIKKGGTPCQIYWDLDKNGFCQYHQFQASSPALQKRLPPSQSMIPLSDKIPDATKPDAVVWDEELDIGQYVVRCKLRPANVLEDSSLSNVNEAVSTFLVAAVRFGDVHSVRRIPSSHVLDARNAHNRTLLHVAAMHDRPAMLKALIELQTEVNARDSFERTAAHYACESGSIACFDLLVENGADPKVLDADGRDLLDIVKANNHLHMIQVLVPHLLGISRNSLKAEYISKRSHEAMEPRQRGGTAKRMSGAAMSFMGRVKGRGFTSRVTPANIPQQGTIDSQENVITTTLTDREESDVDDQFICFHKVCVLGTNADQRKNFIDSIVQPSGFSVEREGKYRLSEWTMTEFIPNDGLARTHRTFFWDIPSEPNLEAVNTLFFSDPTLFMICVDLRDFLSEPGQDPQTPSNDDVFEWIQLIHSRHPSSTIVLVDTSSNMSGEEHTAAMKTFNELKRENRRKYLRSLRRQLQLAKKQSRSPTSESSQYALNQLIDQLTRVNRNAKASEPKVWVKGTVEAKRKTVRAEMIKHKGGYVLNEMHLSIIDAVKAKRDQIAGHNDVDSVIVKKDGLFRLMQPSIDRAVLESTLDLLHELSLVHMFDDYRVKVLAEYICIDMSFLGNVMSTTINAADERGVLAHKNLQLVPPWSEITDKTSVLQLKHCLVATLLAVPWNPQLDWDSDLIVPSRANLTVPSSAMVSPLNPTGSDSTEQAGPQPPPQPTILHCCRKILFGHAPPASLIAKIVAAVHLPPLHFDLSDSVVRLTSDIFTAQISVRSLDSEQDHASCELVLEAVGKYPTRSLTDRSLFQQIFDAMETVLDQYPGLWVTREDATWMPREWMLEDLVRHNESRDRRARAREAIVIDEALYVDRVCVLGPSIWGKTSLVKSITSNTPSLEHEDVRTVGVDLVGSCFIETDSLKARGRRHIVTFCDYAGLARYQPLQALHFPYATLFLICVDLHAYAVALEQAHFRADTETQANAMMNRFVRTQILRWVDKVCFSKKGFELVFAATKADVLKGNTKRIGRMKQHLLVRLRRHVENHTDEIRERLSSVVSNIEGRSTNEGGSSLSLRWIVVSCVTPGGVVAAQDSLKEVIVAGGQGKLLDKSHARALVTILRRRENLIDAEPVMRATQSILTNAELDSWLQESSPSATSTQRKRICDSLCGIGEIMRYERLGGFQLSAPKVIVDPQLVTDLATEVFGFRGPGESLPHAELRHFPLWKILPEATMLEMKRLLQSLRLVHPVNDAMGTYSDLLLVANWTLVERGYNLHVGPRHLRYERSRESTHPHHVRWEYHIGRVIDEAFFERLTIATYSSIYPRSVCSGLIKYTLGTDERDHGPTDKPYCQVWIDQVDSNDDGEYIVCVEAVAATPQDELIWESFALACVGIHTAFQGPLDLVYAIHERRKYQVKDVLKNLRDRLSGNNLEHTLPWMPPNLSWVERFFPNPQSLSAEAS